jgi:hypothetical protein
MSDGELTRLEVLRDVDQKRLATDILDGLQFLNEVVDLRLRPCIPVVPEIQQGIFVARHPVYHLGRHLANDPDGQTVADYGDSLRGLASHRRDALLPSKLSP